MNDKILLVDDDPGTIQVLGRILAGAGSLRFATSGATALRLARESVPDLMLLDAEMPGMSGLQLCKALREDPALADVTVIFVTSHDEAAFEVECFASGAADFIAKPVSPPLFLARVKTHLRVKRTDDALRRIAATEVLNGVADRRRFDESLSQEWRRARRSGSALALLMTDVHHFKRVSDRYGYPTSTSPGAYQLGRARPARARWR